MIESKLGILDYLDEESKLPSGNDTSLITKLYKQFATSKYFEKSRFGQTSFVIKHYATNVTYEVEGFIEKNKDNVSEEQLGVLNSSSLDFLKEITKIEAIPVEESEKLKGSKKSPTLSSIFKASLINLMVTIRKTQVHYIRCIKPNSAKQAFGFEAQMVLQQLRACGVLETIKISCAGYPSRWLYSEFAERYFLLINSINWKADSKKMTELIVQKNIQNEDKFQMGTNKIFFRAGQV